MNSHTRPPSCTTSSTGSTVVPATESTTTRFSPASRLSRLDLPTLGFPTIATRRGPRSGSKSCGGASGSAASTASSRSPLPRPCRAETGIGSPSPRFQRAADSASIRWSSTLLAARTTGFPDRRKILTTVSSASVMPDRRVDHEKHGVGQADGRLGLQRDLLGHPACVGVPPAGVDEREPTAVPLGVVRDPVAGDARDVLDDGLSAAEDPVDEGRLADVRPSDDGQHRGRGESGRRRRRRPRPARQFCRHSCADASEAWARSRARPPPGRSPGRATGRSCRARPRRRPP